jgi:hypothetical protein
VKNRSKPLNERCSVIEIARELRDRMTAMQMPGALPNFLKVW